MKRILSGIRNLGTAPTDTLDEKALKQLFVSGMLASGMLAFLFGFSLFLAKEVLAAGFCFAWATWHLLALVILQRMRRLYQGLVAAQLGLSIGICLTLTYLLGNFIQSGLPLYLLVTVAIAITLLPRASYGLFFLWLLGTFVILMVDFIRRDAVGVPDWLAVTWFLANFITTACTVYFIIVFFLGRNERARQILHTEQTKTDRLLNSIFPAKVAAQVKHSLLDESTVPMVAEYFDEASVLFADMVNFTSMSDRLSPRELVTMLSAVFSHFDRLAEKRGLEKIKTVGDCYIVASGVPQSRSDHAQALAELGLEIQAFAKTYYFSVYKINFRIGIHSGPLIAGVIGQRKISYDLWGDTVNIASRMASGGPGGGIQITSQTHELLKDDFICVPRGKIFVKGKGNMDIWLLTGKKKP